MQRFVILDRDAVHATLTAVTVSRDGVKVESVNAWSDDSPITVGNAEARGKALRDRLAGWKIAAAPLVVVASRDRLVLKEVKFPAVPAHEEPGVVRFQAVKEITDNVDDVVIDYQPRDKTDRTERKALVVAVKREELRIAQLLAQGAGLKLAALTPRSYGLMAAARAANPSPESSAATAVLAISSLAGEFVVFQGEQLLFSRTVAGPALANEAALLGEIRRNLAVYAGQSPQAPVRSLYVAEGETLLGATARIRSTLAIPVHSLDPVPGQATAKPNVVAASFGIARLAMTGSAPINFVKPREPKPQADPHRKPLLIGAAIAVSLMLGLGLIGWLQLSAKDKEVLQLRNELNGLTNDLTQLDPEARKWDEVKKWLDNEIVWLDELYDLAARLPELNKLRIVQFTADPLALPANPDPRRKQYVARVSLKGLATEDDRPLNQFIGALVGEGVYKVDAKQVGPNVLGIDRRNFPLQFTTKFELEKRPRASFTRQFTADKPERRNRGRPGMGGMGDMLNFGGGRP